MDTLQYFDKDFPWLFPVFSFVFGAIVGSFLNVCIYRIPAGKSIIHPGSTCSCGKPIAWYDNIPIFSWFVLRGKARCCGQPYSVRYPSIEFLTGLLFFAAWTAHPPAKAICLMVFASMLICGSFIDLDHMEIPNRFSIGLAVVGVALSTLVPSLHISTEGPLVAASIQSSFESILGVLVGSGLILWIGLLAEVALKKEAMGFGDVKLLGGVGAFLGWQGAIFSIFGGAVVGCLGVVTWMIFNRKKKGKDSEDLIGRQIPFGPMLSAGALIYALLLESHVDKYFEDVSVIFQQTLR